MMPSQATALIHLAGFTAGAVLYVMLVVLSARDHRADPTSVRLAVAAGILGAIWNVGSLVSFGLRDFGIASAPPLMIALAFSALAWVPAVIVHAGSRADARPAYALVGLGYGLSAVASVLHIFEAVQGIAPSRRALLVVTVGNSIVVAALAWRTWRRPGWRRTIGVVLLAAFAVSALHLTHSPTMPDTWVAALLGHHGSIPLVVVLLYQDYRYAFVDTFLRWAVALVLLVLFATLLNAAVGTLHLDQGALRSVVQVLMITIVALSFPRIQRVASRFVDVVVLHRGDYREVRRDLAAQVASAATEAEVQDVVAQVLGKALQADAVEWHLLARSSEADPVASPESSGQQQARVAIPTAEQPSYAVTLGSLRGGRRLLSEDYALLEAAASIAGRRLDVIRVTQERHERSLREEEITRLAAEAQLHALRAQLNPHFLFNALTTVGYLVQTAPERATRALYRLTDLLRAVLRRPAGEFTTLGEELAICEAYLEIERERFEERLRVEVEVPHALRSQLLLPLMLQPLVENAVKHGIAPLRRGGSVRIRAEVDAVGGVLTLEVRDTGAGPPLAGDARATEEEGIGAGVGHRSIRARLRSTYGDRASFVFSRTLDGHGVEESVAQIRVPCLQHNTVPNGPHSLNKS